MGDYVVVLAVVGIFIAFVPLLLLARCSHWAYHTQAKLEDTNKWLAAIHAEIKKRP